MKVFASVLCLLAGTTNESCACCMSSIVSFVFLFINLFLASLALLFRNLRPFMHAMFVCLLVSILQLLFACSSVCLFFVCFFAFFFFVCVFVYSTEIWRSTFDQ